MSTFHGLEMAKQALFAQQSALYTTGHNISNANTDGYSRQRVNFEAMPAYPTPGRNQPTFPGQIGTGVSTGSIERIRDSFLDKQFRSENSRSGYWNTKADALSRMERLLNEPSDSGLSKTMDQFWESLQDLAVNPENTGARSVVAQRGRAVAETFNYLSKTLGSIRTDLKEQIDVSADKANSILRQINQINEQIKQIEPHGHLSNDLYDERDLLIDELSNIVNIKVDTDKSHISETSPNKAIAEGVVSIEIVDSNGNPLGIPLIDGTEQYDDVYFEDLIAVDYEGDAVKSIQIKDHDGEVELEDLIGSLVGLIEAYGYVDSESETGVTGDYPDMVVELNEMAENFAEAFNDVHRKGYDLTGVGGEDFFKIDGDTGAAGLIKVNEKILKDPDLIAASTDENEDEDSDGEGTAGNGQNALDLARIFDEEDSSIRKSFESLIGKLGVDAQEANRMASNTGVLRSQVEEQRLSVSAVSLDEEMTNMIKFQHAYNAAARSMTSMDEMLDRIINNMGLVGR